MGRTATKACGNVWFEARKTAAKTDKRFDSREGAAEVLNMSVSAIAETELGITKCMPVDKAVLMADAYNAPQLMNYYCLHECPIGCRQALSCEMISIDLAVLRLLKCLRTASVRNLKDTMIDVAADGVISKDEEPKLRDLLLQLTEMSKRISAARLTISRELGRKWRDGHIGPRSKTA